MTANQGQILFVLSIDTEEEWDWSGPFPRDNFSVGNTANIPKFQNFCNRLGIRPTYFVDYAVANDPKSVVRLKEPLEKGECEIGAHLHPWCNPPVEEVVTDDNYSHAINLPVDLVSRKLENLGVKLGDVFGVRPNSFRSGRWGTNGVLLKLLSEKGYTVDSSVHPYYEDSSFSYHDAPVTPYWPSFENCTSSGDQEEIIEIQVTAGYNRTNFSLWNKIHLALASPPWNSVHLVGILWRLGVLRKIQLSPELASADDMISLVKAVLKRGHKIIHMYFHSSSLLPGAAPYVKSQADEKVFYNKIETVFRFLQENTELQCCTISEAAKRVLEEKQKCE